jgi:DNA ligase 1
MNSPWTVISELEADNSRLAKEAILKREMLAGNTELFEGIRMALDCLVTFGVKQVPERTGADGAGLSWDVFSLALTGLVNREITGNAARDLIANMMAAATTEQWNGWYRRILIKDLRSGFSDKTVNTVAKKLKLDEYVVPVFACQLAFDSANHEGKMTGKKLISVKLDGIRVLTIVHPDGRVNQFSRNGKELINFEHIRAQFASIASGLERAYVFDGEVMSSSFQDLMKQVYRKTDVNAGDAVLHVFDIVPLEDFQQGVCKLGQDFRSSMLANWFELVEAKLPSVRVLGQELLDLDTEADAARFQEINREAIAAGYEGLMIKDPIAPYECKRSTAWLKIKPWISVDLTAVSVEMGTGKNAGRMGAVVFEGVDDGKLVHVSVGSGWTDSDRDAIWKNQKQVLGQVAEIRADAITLSQNSDAVYSMRFPRFQTWRGFEAGEKI